MTGIDHYYAYAGHTLRTDFPLPELAEADAAGEARFCVRLSADPLTSTPAQWAHDFPDPRGQPSLRCERTASGYRMHFPGAATLVTSGECDVSVHPHPAACLESIRHVLLDQALPRLLAQRGELVLHAAVVVTRPGKTLLLIGESGRGKSTLTGAFFRAGRRVATDDGAVVYVRNDTLVAVPTYRSLRLLPDSRAHLFASLDMATLPVADYSDKRRLPLTDHLESSRVDAIVLLDPPQPDEIAPRLILETPGLACMAMVRHGFQLDLSDTANLQVLLAKAAEAAELVPVYRLEYPRRFDALPDVLTLLEREV